MKKEIITTIILVSILILLIIFIVASNLLGVNSTQNALQTVNEVKTSQDAAATDNSQTDIANNSSLVSINLIKVSATEYNLVLSSTEDLQGTQLAFSTQNQIVSFSPNTIYDTVLENKYDGSNYLISLGKLANKDTSNTKTADGYVIGKFVFNTNISGTTLKLLTSASAEADSNGTNGLKDFSITFP